jgi:hypothetical protein
VKTNKLSAVLLVVLIFATSLWINWQITIVNATTIFEDDFELGNGLWTGGTSVTGSSTIAASNLKPYTNTNSCKVTVIGSYHAYNWYQLASSETTLHVRTYMQYNTTSPSNAFAFACIADQVEVVYNFGTTKWGIMYRNDVFADVTSYEAGTSAFAINTWVWYEVDGIKNNPTSSINLTINGVEKLSLTGLNVSSTNWDQIGAGVDTCNDWGHTTTWYFDTCKVSNSAHVGAYAADSDAPTYSDISNSTDDAGALITFACYWTDTLDLYQGIFGTNNTGIWVNDTAYLFNSNPSWYNVTKNLNETVGNEVQYEWWASDSAGNWNNTGIQTVVVATAPADTTAPTVSQVSASSTVASSTCTFTSYWTDDFTLDYGIFGTNNTGPWINMTAVSFNSTTPSWYSETKTLNETEDNIVQYCIWANDTSGNWANTTILSITITSNAVLNASAGMLSETRAVYLYSTDTYTYNATLLMLTLASYGFNEVYFDTSPCFYTGYSFHHFSDLITAAEAYGIRVGVLFQFYGFDEAYTAASEVAYPQYGFGGHDDTWKMAYANGTAVNWCNFASTTFQARVKLVIQTLVTNFTGISDICLDYVRYPTQDCGFSATIQEQISYDTYSQADFATWLSAHGKTQGTWPNDFVHGASRWDDFAEWRSDEVSEMVHNVRDWALAKRTNITIGAATWSMYGGITADTWKDYMGQDPATWIHEGYIDTLNPMIYTSDTTTFATKLGNEPTYHTGNTNGAVPLIPWITVGGPGGDVTSPLSNYTWSTEINKIREAGGNGFIVWRYRGPGWGDTSFTDNEPYMQLVTSGTVKGAFTVFTSTQPTANNSIISWTTSVTTTGKVEYNTTTLFSDTEHEGTYCTYIDIHYIQGTNATDSNVATTHAVTLPIEPPFYFRTMSNDAYISLSSSMFYVSSSSGVVVIITYPLNTTYTASTIPVDFDASGGVIDDKSWNCKNQSSWIYPSNQTYTSPTSMTGITIDGTYVFYAFATNQEGNSTSETVTFTVSMSGWQSGVTYTCRGHAKDVFISGGTVTDVKVNGITVFTCTDVWVHLEPTWTICITWTSAPSIKVFGE